MDKVKIIEAKESLLADNDRDADRLREEMKQQGTYYVNLMSSPGSGKTSSLKQIIARMKGRFRIGVMEADIDSDVDARTIAASGVDAIQIHTGGMCHLDADMSRQGLSAIGSEKLDLVFLENVGNLVCPAEFDTGADLNVVILSVPEGDDKPLKYPLMFEKADAVLINKIDAMECFDISLDQVKANIHLRKPSVPVFPVSAAAGEGFEAFCSWLSGQIQKQKEGTRQS